MHDHRQLIEVRLSRSQTIKPVTVRHRNMTRIEKESKHKEQGKETQGKEEQKDKNEKQKVSAHTSGATPASTREAGWGDTTIRKEKVDGDVTAGEEEGDRKEQNSNAEL